MQVKTVRRILVLIGDSGKGQNSESPWLHVSHIG